MNKTEPHKYFNYNDGKLYWKISTARRISVGDQAGSLNTNGYLRTMIKNKQEYVHRIIFLIHHGYMPKYIDHIDGNKLNNKIENLRECTQQQNCCNAKINKNNTSGIKGVHWRKDIKKWNARIKVNYKSIYLGVFKNLELAELAVNKAREKYHGKFARSY